MTRAIVLAAGLAMSTATAAAVGYQTYARQQSQPTSLKRGIDQTRVGLDSVRESLATNDKDLDELLGDSGLTVVADGLEKLGFKTLKQVIESAKKAAESTSALKDRRDSGPFLRGLLEAILRGYGEIKGAPAATLASGGLATIDVVAKFAELQLLFAERGRLLVLQNKLQTQLDVLERRQQARGGDNTLAYLEQSEPVSRALSAAGYDVSEVFRQIAVDSQRIGPGALFEIARASSIVEPKRDLASSLQQQPGINPDFIAAVRKCNQLIPTFMSQVETYSSLANIDVQNCLAAGKEPGCYRSQATQNAAISARTTSQAMMTCNKYPDGTYIPAFASKRSASKQSATSAVSVASAVDQRPDGISIKYKPGRTGVSIDWQWQVADMYSWELVENGTTTWRKDPLRTPEGLPAAGDLAIAQPGTVPSPTEMSPGTYALGVCLGYPCQEPQVRFVQDVPVRAGQTTLITIPVGGIKVIGNKYYDILNARNQFVAGGSPNQVTFVYPGSYTLRIPGDAPLSPATKKTVTVQAHTVTEVSAR